jgi:hypothetical protein
MSYIHDFDSWLDAFTFGKQVKILLKRSLKSDQPLTDVLFNQSDEPRKANEPRFVGLSPADDPCSDSSGIKVKLLSTKQNRSVVHAEVGEEFCDILFSFLTLPLGRVAKLLGESSSISCIDNLHKSVEDSLSGCIKSDECRGMVRSPKLTPFFSSN